MLLQLSASDSTYLEPMRSIRPGLGLLGRQILVTRDARIEQWLNALGRTGRAADKDRRALARMPAVPVDVAGAALLLGDVDVPQCKACLKQLFSPADLAASLGDMRRNDMVGRFHDAALNHCDKNLDLEFMRINRLIDEGIPPEIACVSMLQTPLAKNWAAFVHDVAPDEEDAVVEFDSQGIDPLASPHSTLEPQEASVRSAMFARG